MTKRKIITISLLVGVVLLLVGWDIYVAIAEVQIKAGQGATISEIILYYATRHPVIPFACGAVFGHLLWPQYRDNVKNTG